MLHKTVLIVGIIWQQIFRYMNTLISELSSEYMYEEFKKTKNLNLRER